MELVIYSDGFVVSGTDQGAYAMVVTSGDNSSQTRLGSGGGRSPPFTSSFEMETLALSFTVDYVGNTEVGDQCWSNSVVPQLPMFKNKLGRLKDTHYHQFCL